MDHIPKTPPTKRKLQIQIMNLSYDKYILELLVSFLFFFQIIGVFIWWIVFLVMRICGKLVWQESMFFFFFKSIHVLYQNHVIIRDKRHTQRLNIYFCNATCFLPLLVLVFFFLHDQHVNQFFFLVCKLNFMNRSIPQYIVKVKSEN